MSAALVVPNGEVPVPELEYAIFGRGSGLADFDNVPVHYPYTKSTRINVKIKRFFILFIFFKIY